MIVPSLVHLVDVGPRDGLQMESEFIPTTKKAEIIEGLANAGVRRIETTSFVSAKAIPQMSDASELLRCIRRTNGVRYVCLVPNLEGARRAVAAGADVLRVVMAATNSSNLRNIRRNIAESLRECESIRAHAQSAGADAEVVVAVAFGCPFEGDVEPERIVALLRQIEAIGFSEITLADTVGVANPKQVFDLAMVIKSELPAIHAGLHLHNTRGLAMANALAGMQAGIDSFDTSAGGLGGCPLVRGGRGNLPTEDFVYMLEEIGVESGVDLAQIIEVARLVEETVGHPLPSHLLQAGTKKKLYKNTSSNASAPA